MAAGFTAVADHVFAVITALANWLFGMATELIGNIITSPPYSVGCQFFLSCWLGLWHIPISGQWIGNCIGWLVDWIFACLINWLDWSSLQLTDRVNSFSSGWLTRIGHFGSHVVSVTVVKKVIHLHSHQVIHAFIHTVSQQVCRPIIQLYSKIGCHRKLIVPLLGLRWLCDLNHHLHCTKTAGQLKWVSPFYCRVLAFSPLHVLLARYVQIIRHRW